MLDIKLIGTSSLIATEIKKNTKNQYLFRLIDNSNGIHLMYIGKEITLNPNEENITTAYIDPEPIKRVLIKPKLEVIYEDNYIGYRTFGQYNKPHIKEFRIDPSIFDTLLKFNLIRYNQELATFYGLPKEQAFNYQKKK